MCVCERERGRRRGKKQKQEHKPDSPSVSLLILLLPSRPFPDRFLHGTHTGFFSPFGSSVCVCVCVLASPVAL